MRREGQAFSLLRVPLADGSTLIVYWPAPEIRAEAAAGGMVRVVASIDMRSQIVRPGEEFQLMAGFQLSRCKGCGAEILFARSVTGKTIPLDAHAKVYQVKRGGDGVPEATPIVGHVSHFNTCPKASSFSGRSRRAQDAADGSAHDQRGPGGNENDQPPAGEEARRDPGPPRA